MKDEAFEQIIETVLLDSDLTWQAKGMFLFLLGKTTKKIMLEYLFITLGAASINTKEEIQETFDFLVSKKYIIISPDGKYCQVRRKP